jgi:hypothetical protein
MTSAAGALVFGKQYRPVDVSAGLGPREQIGVGGTGFGHHIELTPRHTGPDQPVAQGSHVQGRPVDGVGWHDAVLFSLSAVECAFWASTVR